MAIDICTASDVKAFLGKDEGETDGALDFIVDGTCRQIERYIRSVVRHTKIEYETWHGNGVQDIAVLKNGPITSVTLLAADGVEMDASTEALINGRTLTRLSGGKPLPWSADVLYLATYWAGYEDIPADLRLAAIQQAAFTYRQSSLAGSRLGLSSRSGPQGETDAFVDGGWLPQVLEVLHTYRQMI